MSDVQPANDNEIEVPYLPRRHFRALHASSKRWQFMCCHRRAGKTVAIANHLIRAASRNTRKWPPPRYAYVGPSFDQAKDLVWSYLKQYTEKVPGARYLEGDLACVLPTGATIKLYGGAAAYERMRGMYFDGIALDEYPLLNPAVFSTVVRPCLADYGGFALISGTSNGDDHFNQLRLRNEDDPRWDFHIIPLSATGEEALSKEEAAELVQDMSAEEYAREMECSFDAPVEGSYYGEILNKLAMQGRITSVPADLATPVITAWDLGIHDFTCIWLYQIAGKEIHFIDYIQDQGKGLDHYALELQTRAHKGGFKYKAHCLPHDVEARELSTGRSRRGFLIEKLDEPVITAPMANPTDGIAAARSLLGLCWFDQVKCRKGLAMLRGYRKNKMGQPVHGPEPYCVEGDTIVLTRNGPKCIKDLPETGEVLTPCGWKPYRQPRVTRRNAPLVAVAFADGLTVNCTPEHMFLTTDGWKLAAALGRGSKILSSLTPQRSISMASSTAFTKRKDTFREAKGVCMSTFGRMSSASGRPERISTIVTAILPTIQSTIWNAWPRASISNGPGETGTLAGFPTRLANSPVIARLSGTAPIRGGLGTNGMPPTQKAGKNGSVRTALASIAARFFPAWPGKAPTHKDIAPQFAKDAIIVESVAPLPYRADVWCLTVDDGHWWSLANGAVSHNSHGADAFRTFATAFHLVGGLSARSGSGPLRRSIRGLV